MVVSLHCLYGHSISWICCPSSIQPVIGYDEEICSVKLFSIYLLLRSHDFIVLPPCNDRGFVAPQLNLEAIKAAYTSSSFEEGLKEERRLFTKLATGPQSRALQHVFFSQRQISKVPGIDSKLATDIKKVGVIGCGMFTRRYVFHVVCDGV